VTVTFDRDIGPNLVMASVVYKKSVISCVNHAVTNVIGCPNRILPIAHVSLVVTVSIFLISYRDYYPTDPWAWPMDINFSIQFI